MNFSFRIPRSLLIALLSLLIVGCSSETRTEPPTVTATATTSTIASVTPVPIPTEQVVPTAASDNAMSKVPTATSISNATPTAVQVPTATQIAVIQVVPDTIRTSICIASNNNGSRGTAPGPTPTPEAEQGLAGHADPEDFRKVAATVGYLIESMIYWSETFESDWEKAFSSGSQAEALISLEGRFAALCGAAASVPKVFGTDDFRSRAIEGVRIRHAWVVLAIQELLCCGDANVPEMNSGRSDTHQYLLNLGEKYASEFGEIKMVERQYVFDDERLHAKIPPAWLASQGSSELTLIAPLNNQFPGTAGLGPKSLQIGVGIVIRSFGLPSVQTLDSVFDQFGHLPATRGTVLSQDDGTLFDQEAIWWSIDSDGWIIRFGLTVEGQDLYFVEYGCPSDKLAWCDESALLLDGFTITAE